MSEPLLSDKVEKSRLLRGLAVVFVLYLLYLLFAAVQGRVSDRFSLEPVDQISLGTALGSSAAGGQVIFQATFDEQGFPVARPEPGLQKEPGMLVGKREVETFLREKLDNLSPEQILKNFAGNYGRYWKDPRNPEFLANSQEMGRKLTATAERNKKLVQSLSRFLSSDAGKLVSSVLKDNLAKAVGSPARAALNAGFTAWKNGDLEQAYQMLKQAEALDPHSPYIQIIAHQGMAFLNMERHGPLEETMRQYRDLADESHKYITSFRPALEKAGFDPVKLYGRDPFDASGLPTREQFEKAMDQSRYVQFEREFYKSHPKSPGRALEAMQGQTIEYLRKRQRGGQK